MNIRILIQNALKSKTFLISLILMSVSKMLNLINLMTNLSSDNYADYANAIDPELYSKLGLDKFYLYINTISILNSIPAIIILAGMYVLYCHSRNGELLQHKTSGLTIIKTGIIMYIVQIGILVAAAIVYLFIIFGYTNNVNYYIVFAMVLLFILMIIIALVVIYYISIIRFINILKYSLVTGKPSVKYLTLTGVLNYIMIGFSCLSIISVIFQGIIKMIPLILNTIALFLITTKMFEYKTSVKYMKN